MSEMIRISTPFTAEQSRRLKAGDCVLITGSIYCARDAAHKRMTEALARGEKLPVDWRDQIVYYAGPTPPKPGDAIGSVGPTTSGRMDAYAPKMLREAGMRGMIGKGSRSPAVVEAMRETGATYFVAVGGAGALIGKSVKAYRIVAYEDLGPEALAELTVVDFPAVVGIDCEGGDFYQIGQAPYRRI
ncbi:MAG: Fe-S-containing hydro-lyase [Duodenibacillus sp.]|nr:Fe-S-containing hydro-lyase [Duodenibacillus sp.]